MQKAQAAVQYPHKYFARVCGGRVVVLQAWLCKLYVPVAVAVPDKIVYFLYCYAKFEFFKIFVYFLCNCIKFAYYPFVFQSKFFRQIVLHVVIIYVHMYKSRSVPKLVGKIAAGNNLFFYKPHIVSGCIACGKEQPQGVCAVFVDYKQRVYAVAK